jgi:DHA2 family multidrug resistance protein
MSPQPQPRPTSRALRLLPGTITRTAYWSLLLATFLQAIDLTISTLALPAIEHDLGLSAESGSWIMTSYIVATALVTPVAGPLSAVLGRRALVLVAIGGLTLASAGCAAAPSLATLIGGRIAQGAAAGMIMPLVQMTLFEATAPVDHGRAMSFFAAAAMIGPVLGPPLGGVLVDIFGWRAIFLINLPIGAVAFLGVAIGMRGLRRIGVSAFDPAGFALFSVGIIGLQLLLDRGMTAGWFAAPEIILYAAAAVVGIAGSLRRAVARPLSFPPLTAFRTRNFSAAAAANFLIGFVMIGTVFLVPSLLQRVLGQDATATGLAVAPRAVGTLLVILAMNRVVGRIDHRIPLLTGTVLVAGSALALALAGGDASVALVALLSLAAGAGGGFLFTPLSTAALSGLDEAMRVEATGIYALLRSLGGSLAVAALSIVLAIAKDASGDPSAAYRDGFLLLLAACLAIAAAVLLIRPPSRLTPG